MFGGESKDILVLDQGLRDGQHSRMPDASQPRCLSFSEANQLLFIISVEGSLLDGEDGREGLRAVFLALIDLPYLLASHARLGFPLNCIALQ